MRWEDRGTSSDIEDRRDEPGGGGGPGIRLGLGGIILLGVLSLVFHRNFFALLGNGDGDVGQSQTGAARAPGGSPEEEKTVHFVSFVLDDVQNTWTREFQQMGRPYDRSKLVLFTNTTRSGCGYAESAMGPFYCPADQKVYIDLGFYTELRRRFGAPGDFAQAYVLAHEVGHHVQDLLGLEERMRSAQERRPSQAKALSVRFELQADCLAGVWAHSTNQRHLLEAGDVESAMGAAAAVGDDRIQKQATGHVNPETFTHGSSQQRTQWFKTGLEAGRIEACDTFAAS
jgi:predicted metalloprotease